MDIGIEQARKNLGDLANRAQLAGDIAYLTRNGKRIAAIVPLERVMPVTETSTETSTYERIGRDAEGQWTDTITITVHTYSDGSVEVSRVYATDGETTAEDEFSDDTTANGALSELRRYTAELENDGYEQW